VKEAPVGRSAFLAALSGLAALACTPSPGAPAPAATPKKPPLPAVAGPQASAEGWRVSMVGPAPVTPGASATARVVVTALPPYHVNRDYPMSFRRDASSTASLGGDRVALGDGADRTPCADHPEETCTVSSPLPFTAPQSGEARLAGTVAFSVCNPDRCLIEKVPLSVLVSN
jgi:hypothetical protein